MEQAVRRSKFTRTSYVATSTENKLLKGSERKENVGTDKESSCQTSTKQFKLSLYCCKPPNTTEVKVSHLKDSVNTAPKSSQFSKLISSPDREKVSKGVIPANTVASLQWAIRNFNE